MEITKGKVYNVNQDQWMQHSRAEYHSTYNRKCDGVPLHNMIISMNDGFLDVGLFTADGILSEAEEPV